MSFLGGLMLRWIAVVVAMTFAAPPASAQDRLRIAVLGPMAFIQGEHHWFGAELARDEINKAGGISVGGKKVMIDLIRVDTNEIQSVPDATNAMERAITRERADVVMGGFRSEAVLAMQEIAMDAKKLFLGCGAGDLKLTANVGANYDRYKYFFRITPLSSPNLGRSVFAILNEVAGQIRTNLKKEQPKVAILAEKVIWTEAIIKAAQATLPKMGMEVVGVWQPSPVATDITAELAAIDRAGADIVFTVISGPVGVVVGRQMGERKMRAIAFGINVEAQKDGFWAATAGQGNFVSTLDTYADVERTPKTMPFMRAFRERFKVSPTYTAGTYDAIYLLKEAIETAGTTNADKLVPVIEKMQYVSAAGVIEFDKTHDPIWGIERTTGVGVQWQDGKKVAFWPPQVKGMQPFRLPPQQ
jgi:branched-chain amino acid transport system substrate-binding protein